MRLIDYILGKLPLYQFLSICIMVVLLGGADVGCQRTTSSAVTNDWQTIIPLQTKRGEIERFKWILKLQEEFTDTFETPFGIVTIWYIGAKEPDGAKCEWNRPVDTVNSYSVSFAEPVLASTLGYNLRAFKKTTTHLERTVFTNREIGVSFAAEKIRGKGHSVSMVQVNPRLADLSSSCIGVKSPQPRP